MASKKIMMEVGDDELNQCMDIYETEEVSTCCSYWDILPHELKDYIIELANSQLKRDLKQRERQWRFVCKEVELLANLKREWTYGKIHLKWQECQWCRKCYLKYKHNTLHIYGDFTEQPLLTPIELAPGYTYKALLGCNDIHSILEKMSNIHRFLN